MGSQVLKLESAVCSSWLSSPLWAVPWLSLRLMLMPTMAGEGMALATEAMVDTVWDTPDTMVDTVWDTPLVPMDTALWDTEATTSARGRLRLSQRLNPRLTLMPTMAGEAMALDTEAMVDTVWDTPDSMVDMVWDTPLVPMDIALWDTAVTTSARERLRLSLRLMPMPTMAGEAMASATEAMVDTVWDTAPMDILVMLDMEATDTDADTATMVEREVICYKRSRLTDY